MIIFLTQPETNNWPFIVTCAPSPSCGISGALHEPTSCKAVGWDRRKQRLASLSIFFRRAERLIFVKMPVSNDDKVNAMFSIS